MQDPMLSLLNKFINKSKEAPINKIIIWKVIQDLEELIGDYTFDPELDESYKQGCIDAYSNCIKLIKEWILNISEEI